MLLASTTSAVQPMGIPAGSYTINEGDGGGGSSAVVPAYCLDHRLPSPQRDSTYRDVLAGGGTATAQFPDGTIMPLEEALNKGILTITGDGEEGAWDRLRITGPIGTVIRVKEPIALGAEPWLQDSAEYKLDNDFWAKAAEELRGTPDRHDEKAQESIWRYSRQDSGLHRTQHKDFQRIFGESGSAIIQELAKAGEIQTAHLSLLGKQPVVRITLANDGDLEKKILFLEEGKPVLKDLNVSTIRAQYLNIHKRLNPLAKDGVAFLAETKEGTFLFIDGKSSEPAVLEANDPNEILGAFIAGDNSVAPMILKSTEAIEAWLKQPRTQRCKLIMVSEETGPKSKALEPFVLDNLIPSSVTRQIIVDQIWDKLGDLGKSLEVFEDDNPELAVKNLKARKTIKSAADLSVFWDSVISRAGFVPDMASQFKQAGISYHDTPDIIASGNLLIISGHKASNYRNYLAELAVKGLLKGKAVVLLSCAELNDAEFCRYLIQRGEAISVLRVNHIIPEGVVPSILREICQTVKSLPEEGLYVEELLERAINSAVGKTKSRLQKQRLLQMLENAIQVSQIIKE